CAAFTPNSVSYTIQPWFPVTAAVVKIGSSTVRLACGTKRSTRALGGWAIEKRGSVVAATPAAPVRRNARRCMICPLLIAARQHVEYHHTPEATEDRGWPYD